MDASRYPWGWWGALMRLVVILLFMLATTGLWALPAWGQYEQRQIQIETQLPKLNGGRTFYLLVKKTTETSFLTEEYDEISAMVSAKKASKDMILSQLVWLQPVRFPAAQRTRPSVFICS